MGKTKPDIFTYDQQAEVFLTPPRKLIDLWVAERLSWMVPKRLMMPLLWAVFKHFFALAVTEPENPWVRLVLDSVHGHARFWLYRAMVLQRLATEGDPAPLVTLRRLTGTKDPEKQARWCMEQYRHRKLDETIAGSRN